VKKSVLVGLGSEDWVRLAVEVCVSTSEDVQLVAQLKLIVLVGLVDGELLRVPVSVIVSVSVIFVRGSFMHCPL